MMLLQVILALVGVLAFLGLARLALELGNRWPQWGALALFVWLATFAFFIEEPERFAYNVGGITVAVPDVLCAFLAAIAALRFLTQPPAIARPFFAPLLVVSALLALSYLRGVAAYGLQPATNEFREFFYFLSALGFAVSFPADRLAERIPRIAMIGGAFLVMVALARVPMMDGFGLDQRAVPSYVALAMGQAFFFGWAWLGLRSEPATWGRWLVLAFLLLAFLMLHRSVWLALAGGLVTLVLFERTGRGALLTLGATALVVAAVGVGVVAGDKVMAGLHQAVEEATSSEQSTFLWRLDGWRALLTPESGWDVGNLLVGYPMGTGYARSLEPSVLNTNEIEAGVIPHNYYISLILRGGVIGVIAFLALYAALARLFLRELRRGGSSTYATCFLVILVTQVIYYVPYSADMIQGVFLGAGIALASAIYLTREGRQFSS